MNKLEKLQLRVGASVDREGIVEVCRLAFGDSESQSIAELSENLVRDADLDGILNFVAEDEGILGFVSFSPLKFDYENALASYILCPLAVHRDAQNKGLGSRLVEFGLNDLRAKNADFAIVYGDPKYYGRFGFSAELGEAFQPPYPLEHPFGWQAVALSDREPPKRPLSVACVPALSRPELW